MRNKTPARVFAALGDEMRLHLVARLNAGGAQSITCLTAGTKLTRQAITKHLRFMQRSGIVRCSHRGRETLWELEPRRIAQARQYLDTVSAQWDAALDRLRTLVED